MECADTGQIGSRGSGSQPLGDCRIQFDVRFRAVRLERPMSPSEKREGRREPGQQEREEDQPGGEAWLQ